MKRKKLRTNRPAGIKGISKLVDRISSGNVEVPNDLRVNPISSAEMQGPYGWQRWERPNDEETGEPLTYYIISRHNGMGHRRVAVLQCYEQRWAIFFTGLLNQAHNRVGETCHLVRGLLGMAINGIQPNPKHPTKKE